MSAVRDIIKFECPKCEKFWPAFFFNTNSEFFSGCEDLPPIMKAKAEFYDRVIEFGGRVIGRYINNRTRIKCICREGHECDPIPTRVQQGSGMCRACSGTDPVTAEETFRKRITGLGGEVLGNYQGSRIPVECICAKGHECNPMPDSIQQGYDMCKICSGRSSVISERNFQRQIIALGGVILGKYVRGDIPVKCRCKNGHECNLIPHNIRQNKNICMICSGRDPNIVEQNFRDRISELGGMVLGEYRGNKHPIKCVCKKGHKCSPAPTSVQQGGGMCKTCSGKDSVIAKENFQKRIVELGGTVLGTYLGGKIPVKCICKKGHECYPKPTSIQQGDGMCSSCGLKSEPLCREIFEQLLGCRMRKIRPKWLMWNHGMPLELDGYNEKMKIAFEYQGIHHTQYLPIFHPNGPKDLENQQKRDIFKAQICLERGITLICVPCDYTYRDPEAMKTYITTELIKHKIVK